MINIRTRIFPFVCDVHSEVSAMAPPRTGQQTHKSGPLKQKNKIHKTGRHRSKGALDLEQKGFYLSLCLFCYLSTSFLGRVPSLSSIASSKKGLSRIARRNKATRLSIISFPFAVTNFTFRFRKFAN